MKLSVVLLCHEEVDMVQQCLNSLRKNAREADEIIVVYNASAPYLRKYLTMQHDIKLISNLENPGIARSYNQGAAMASGDYILFLNSNSVLNEHSASNMISCLQSHQKAAMVGPLSNEVSGHQRIAIPDNCPAAKDDSGCYLPQTKPGDSQQVFRLLSHCLLVKKELFFKVGCFDERFGKGTYEDDDLCFRFVNTGYELYIARDAFVYYNNPFKISTFDQTDYYRCLAENKQKAIDKWGFDIAAFLHNKTINPITISLCMIVKNEEAVLGRCLDSVKDIADEIIIVDTGSTDNTKAIVTSYNAKIFDFTWIDDFAAARNFAFAQASQDYILWLDADDIIQESDRLKLMELKKTLDPGVDSVTMHYNLGFDDYGNVIASLRRNRLVKRARNFRWIGPVHEFLEVYGQIINSDIAVTHSSLHHDSERNLRIYEKRLASGEVFSARDMYYYANELLDHRMIDQAITWYQKFLDTEQGWSEDNLAACRKLTDCFHDRKDRENAEKYMFKSFLYDIPRADICCRLGYHFQSDKRFPQAIFWYKLATELIQPDDNWGLTDHACWTWLPHLQLCLCYDQLGEYKLANQHNEMAAQFLPDDPHILHNREYFSKIDTAEADPH